MLGALHKRFVAGRRVQVLAGLFAELVPQGSSLLDLGCGNGHIATRLKALRPDLTVTGIDTMVRPESAFPVQIFDGRRVPLADGSVDVTLLCDVLHHTGDPAELLAEARRVSRRAIVLKDHFAERNVDRALLAVMDFVGNPRTVERPHRYLSEAEWRELWQRTRLVPRGSIVRSLGLYRAPWNRVFDRHLHFAVVLEPQ